MLTRTLATMSKAIPARMKGWAPPARWLLPARWLPAARWLLSAAAGLAMVSSVEWMAARHQRLGAETPEVLLEVVRLPPQPPGATRTLAGRSARKKRAQKSAAQKSAVSKQAFHQHRPRRRAATPPKQKRPELDAASLAPPVAEPAPERVRDIRPTSRLPAPPGDALSETPVSEIMMSPAAVSLAAMSPAAVSLAAMSPAAVSLAPVTETTAFEKTRLEKTLPKITLPKITPPEKALPENAPPPAVEASRLRSPPYRPRNETASIRHGISLAASNPPPSPDLLAAPALRTARVSFEASASPPAREEREDSHSSSPREPSAPGPSPVAVTARNSGGSGGARPPGFSPHRPETLDAGFGILGGLPRPLYPDRARRLGRGGSVVLEILVGPDGKVMRVVVVRESSGWGFGAAAREAYAKAVFTPPRANGRPVRVLWRKTLRFRP